MSKDKDKFEEIMSGVPFAEVGLVTGDGLCKVYGRNDTVILNARINELKEAWQAPLRW